MKLTESTIKSLLVKEIVKVNREFNLGKIYQDFDVCFSWYNSVFCHNNNLLVIMDKKNYTEYLLHKIAIAILEKESVGNVGYHETFI